MKVRLKVFAVYIFTGLRGGRNFLSVDVEFALFFFCNLQLTDYWTHATIV